MEFKSEELVEREIEIGGYMVHGLSMKQISLKTGLSKKHVATHKRNMMEKLKTTDMTSLIKLLETMELS